MKYFLRFVLLCVFTGAFLPCETSAASLFGKVIEVNSGDVITIFNLNRPVRVRLLGVDAPEMDQAFGDVAKNHLSALVYDKSVLVEYSGIAADSSLTGRVLLNNADICAQMIRDGAAWFDVNNVSRVNVSDREVYQQSELAARNERRGLWQAEKPTAPWDFVKAEALRKNPVAQLNAISPPKKAVRGGPVPELTSLNLLKWGGSNSSSPAPNSREERLSALTSTPKSWIQFRPEGENFSILAPDEGVRDTVQESEDGDVVDVHQYIARDGWASYVLTWMKVPTNGRTLETALDEVREGIREGPRTYGEAGEFSCGSVPETKISMNGYVGREFDLTSCTLPAKARVYLRRNEDYIQVYMALTVFLRPDDNVARFLNSFTVSAPEKKTPRKP